MKIVENRTKNKAILLPLTINESQIYFPGF